MATDVRRAYSAPVAVIGATYSGRNSRIVLWRTDTDEVVRGQSVKGGLELLDLSADGKYLGYYVQAHHRRSGSYIAISRPPYLTALLFVPCFHLHTRDIHFGTEATLQWFAGKPEVYDEAIREYRKPRIEPGCPLKTLKYSGDPIEKYLRRESRRPGMADALDRFGPMAVEVMRRPRTAADVYPSAKKLAERASSANWDHRGRFVLCSQDRVYLFSKEEPDGKLLVDVSDSTFVEIPPPEWARTWTGDPD